MNKIGLVLEGGGMRGVYTGGVLEYFLEQELFIPYIVGVSAGVCNAVSYMSKQKGRNKKVTVDYVNHPRYISYMNFFREKSLFGMDLIFDHIPRNLVPFDFDAFQQATQRLVIGTTDSKTGKPYYIEHRDCNNEQLMTALRASCSLPFISPMIELMGQSLMDGGIADPIPLKKSIEDGNEKHIVILTKDKGHRKNPLKYKWLADTLYPNHPQLIEALSKRYQVYNDTMDLIEALEAEKKVFVIRPTQGIQVKRVDKNKKNLESLYSLGYEDAASLYPTLISWLQES